MKKGNKLLKIIQVGKNNFLFDCKRGYCSFCLDRVRKNQGDFCDLYCQGYYDSRDYRRKMLIENFGWKQEEDYEVVSKTLLDKIVKIIPFSYADFQAGKSPPLHEFYTEEELQEKPLNEVRFQLVEEARRFLRKKREKFLYCFFPECSKPFEVTPWIVSPFFCSRKCLKNQREMMKNREWRKNQDRLVKEHEAWKAKIKENKEIILLQHYGYSKEDLSSFRELFGGEITKEKLELFFKLSKKCSEYFS